MKRRSIFFACSIFFAFSWATVRAAATLPGPTGLAAAMQAPQSPAAAKVMFHGTEYFLRPSQGNTSDFTPRGQEDLSTFTDMLDLNIYPGAHDQEALATITTRTQAVLLKNKGTMLPSNSGQQPGEQFFAATLPTGHGMDFDAIRFVLIDNQVFGVFYTHRSYGPSAAGATSEWVSKQAADFERQLLQFDVSRMVSAQKFSANPSLAAADTDLPAGTIKKGTLTSPQLRHDTMTGVGGKVAMLGCNKVEDVSPYVVTPFSGAPGTRQWQEKWLAKGCGKQYAVDISFKEDGAGGADWTIKN